MRVVVRTVSWVLVFVAIGAAVASWFTPKGELDATDAAEVAVDALASVGFEGTVDEVPERGVHRSDRRDPADVWVVFVTVDDEPIEAQVLTTRGQLVYVDDRIGEDDTGRLLTDDQFVEIGAYRDTRLLDAWVMRNAAGTVAALVLGAVGFVLARRSAPLWSEPVSPEKELP